LFIGDCKKLRSEDFKILSLRVWIKAISGVFVVGNVIRRAGRVGVLLLLLLPYLFIVVMVIS